MNPLAPLSRFVRDRAAPPPGERCELCGAVADDAHPHVVDLERRALCCACRPCALLFDQPATGEASAATRRYLRVPDRVLSDPGFRIDEETWEALDVPVRLAFFFHHSGENRRVALYPSPAGPMESELPLDAWDRLAAATTLASSIRPDVEALLAWGPKQGDGLECLLVPIDACYELVGLVRKQWRGFTGAEAREGISEFLDRLRARSRPVRKGEES